MSQDFAEKVEIYITAIGAAKTVEELDQLQKELDDLRRAAGGQFGGDLEKSFNKAFGAIDKARKGMQGFSQATDQSIRNLPRLRYALHDVSTTLTRMGLGMTALGVATVGTSIKMERQFADVIRTTMDGMTDVSTESAAMRREFTDLFTTLPVSWAALTEIGTLAGQLGVASENITEFTSLVAKFSATTDVSVEQAATAFGRLSQLLDVPAHQYENLGSSILAVGVASVATESQIINTSAQIASMGNFAGMSAHEVFGLSATLASLGTQPELSRGTITRLFSNISTAIANGGERLEAFARVTRMTADQFKASWSSDATGTLREILAGLNTSGDNAVMVLRDLGVTAARDVPTILRLAQNIKLLDENLKIAADGYRDGSALQEHYGVIAETTAEKLTLLRNNLQALVDSIGSGSLGPLSFLLDGLNNIVNGFRDLNESGAWQFQVLQATAALVPVVAALVGALSLAGGAFTRAVASSLAYRTAMYELAVAHGVAKTAAEAQGMGIVKLTSQISAATGAAKGLRVALITTGVGAALVAVTSVAAMIAGKTNEASEAAERMRDSFATAIQEDTVNAMKNGAEGMYLFSKKVENAGSAAETSETIVRNYAQTVLGLSGDADEAAGSMQRLEVAIGGVSEAALRQSLLDTLLGDSQDSKEQAQRLQMFDELFHSIGVSYDELVQSIQSGQGVPEQINEMLDRIAWENLNFEQMGVMEGFDGFTTGSYEANLAAERLLESIINLNANFQESIDLSLNYQGAQERAGIASQDLADDFDMLAESMSAANEVLKGLEGNLQLNRALEELGQSIAENGDAWDQFSSAGMANLESLADVVNIMSQQFAGDPLGLAQNLQALYDLIAAQTPGAVVQLAWLKDMIYTLAGGPVQAATVDFTSFFNGIARGANNAGSAAKKAKKEIRTLLDWAKDLAGVWDRAFDLRFGSQLALDKITESFISMREAIEASERAVQELRVKISGLETDRNTQLYFLSIAEEYNDTLRAAEIRQNLLEIEQKLADAQAELAEEQDAASKALTGNSKAAINNRKQVTDLVKEYRDYLETLAANGATQDELSRATARLKQEFIAQTTAMGYSRSEIETYAKAFDDMIAVIARVPRNITVAANTDPAIQALNEYEAKLRSVQSTVAKGGFTPSFDDSAYKKAARAAALQAQIHSLTKALTAASVYGPAQQSIKAEIDRLKNILNSGNYWTGGYTGRGGVYEPAGVVHRGEYVIPAKDVDQRTGRPYADAAMRHANGVPAPRMGSGYAGGGYVGGGQVDLSYASIMAIARAVQPHLILDGQAVAKSVNRQSTMSNLIGAS